ncbi:MAG: endoribonuclease MazF [Spirochaetes bacterium]|nr:endoribonuclease MazF [Spirochaetota bacterium]
MVAPYVPGRGDLIWLDFTPQAGHEQRGRRPALVLSPREYNGTVGLALVCPVTSKIKGYPFEVPISNRKVTGVVLADQVRSLDWASRHATFIATIAGAELEDVMTKLKLLLS